MSDSGTSACRHKQRRRVSYRRYWILALLLFFAVKCTAKTCQQASASSPCSANEAAGLHNASLTVYIEPSRTLVRQTVSVAAGRALSYNFPLIQGTLLVAKFQVSGGANDKIKVWLLDALNYQRYLSKQQFSYFQGTSGIVQNTSKCVFRVPQTGIYFLVLDNSGAWLLPRTVQLYVYGILPAAPSETVELQRNLGVSLGSLGELFVFPSFRIEVKHCGVENAFSNPNITVCTELVESLVDKHLDQAVAFVLLHELGHSLMRLWGQPMFDNEDDADQFATVFLILAKQEQTALQAAQWYASQTSEQEALAKLWLDDRHAVSPQRARNIFHWLNQPGDLVQRWFRVFVPNMQTSALLQLLSDSDVRINKEMVRAELRARGCLQ
jgi:Zn-dependent protease with chaperone function